MRIFLKINKCLGTFSIGSFEIIRISVEAVQIFYVGKSMVLKKYIFIVCAVGAIWKD